jgi:uncharacterized OB-fold protein
MPVPSVSVHTRPWWDALVEHRLVVQTCTACGTTRHPPAPRCWACRSAAHEWADVPGTGVVYTFTVVHQAFVPALADHLPHVVAAAFVELDGGARVVTNIVDCDPGDVRIGLPVAVVWDDLGPALTVPRFRPA